MRSRSLVALALVSMTTVAPAPARATAVVDTDGSSVSLADVLDFRTTFGFTVDADVITVVGADESADRTFGVPLTETEADNMRERQRLEALADEAEEFVNDHPDDVGGFYLTQDTGNARLFIIATQASSSDVVDAATALVPDGLTVDVVTAAFSESALLAAADVLWAHADGLGLVRTGVDTRANRLVATVLPGHDPAAVSALVSVPVDASIGEAPEAIACWDNCSPWRGGMNVLNDDFPGDGNCSWGYYGTRGTASKYMLTAGHCGGLGDAFHLVAGPAVITDGADRNTFDSASTMFADATVARVKANASAHSPFNSIIASSSDLAHPITVRKGNAQGQGATVCFFGVPDASGLAVRRD
jgi:hypothetical protein